MELLKSTIGCNILASHLTTLCYEDPVIENTGLNGMPSLVI